MSRRFRRSRHPRARFFRYPDERLVSTRDVDRYGTGSTDTSIKESVMNRRREEGLVGFSPRTRQSSGEGPQPPDVQRSSCVGRTLTEKSKDHTAHGPGKAPRQPFTLAWRSIFLAAVPVAVSVYYVSWVAPVLEPVPAGLHVFSPDVTRFLEGMCSWCGEHWWAVVLIGFGLLVPGSCYRLVAKRERYYFRLAIIVSLALGFTYLNISAPIGRLGRAVDEAIPVDERVPNHETER